jgi:hypothetical protein
MARELGFAVLRGKGAIEISAVIDMTSERTEPATGRKTLSSLTD